VEQLLDEPSLGLDPLVQRAFRVLVQEFASRGSAVLLSSHILSEVEAVCNRVAIVRAGEIVTVEAVDAMRRRVVRRMSVRFHHDVPAELGRTPGVERVEENGSAAVLWIRGDVNPLLRVLALAARRDRVPGAASRGHLHRILRDGRHRCLT
jgi:ABC-2 type transport system ATP-binding protein